MKQTSTIKTALRWAVVFIGALVAPLAMVTPALAQSAPPTTQPSSGSASQGADLVKQALSAGPDWGVVAPLIGVIVVVFGIMLAVAFMGGLFHTGVGIANYGVRGHTEKGAAASRKQLGHGVTIMVLVLLSGVLAAVVFKIFSQIH